MYLLAEKNNLENINFCKQLNENLDNSQRNSLKYTKIQ